MSQPFFARAQPTWKPPTLIGGKFQSQADFDAWHKTLLNSGITKRTGEFNTFYPSQATPGGPTNLEEHGPGSSGANYDPVTMANSRAAAQWGEANGFYKPPPGGSGGFFSNFFDTVVGFGKDVILSPPVLAALTAGVGSALGAGAGAGAGTTAAETGAFDAATGLYDVASAPSTMAALSAAEYPGAVGAVAGAGAGTAAATAPGSGGNAGVYGGGSNGGYGGGTQSAAAGGGGAPTAASTMQLVKDYGGLALTLGGLLSAGGSAPDIPNAPPPPEAPPESQAARQPDEIARRRNASTGSTDNTLLTGASGIDPFTLNLGRSKLLGQ